MSLRSIAKVILLSSLTTSFAYAAMPLSKITCPPVSVIQQASQKIDNAVKFDESYIALSSVPVFKTDGKQWRIEVELNAKSRKQAIKLARKAVEEISFCEQETATDPGDGAYYCDYGPVKFAAVHAAIVP